MDVDAVQAANREATKGGRYRYTRVLGRGGFGVVLKGRYAGSGGKEVAVKIIEGQRSLLDIIFFRSPDSSRQGKKEAELLTDLRHDNVITIRDHFEYKGSQWKTGLAIVMDYCSGGDLQHRLEELRNQGNCLTVNERLRWYKQLASALEYIHGRGIAHRDLKPGNILLDGAGNTCNLIVADVGIAKKLCDSFTSDYSYQHYMNTFTGTLPYMAPEVFSEHYTAESDVFSLGLVMFVICARKLIPHLPWRTNTFLGHYMHCNSAAQGIKPTLLLNLTAQNCRSDEKQLLDDMLQYDYHRRPTAADVVQRIRAIEVRKRQEEEEERRRREEEERRKRREEEERRRRREEEERRWRWREEEGRRRQTRKCVYIVCLCVCVCVCVCNLVPIPELDRIIFSYFFVATFVLYFICCIT